MALLVLMENFLYAHKMKPFKFLLAWIVVSLIYACGRVSPQIQLKLVADGFTSPVALVSPEDESGRLFVVDQVGLIWIIAEHQRLPEPFLDLRNRLVTLSAAYDERGLLGLAFHPDFVHNGRFYVCYSAPLREGLSPAEWDHTTYISEFTVSTQDLNQADPASEQILLSIDKPGYNYEAGNLAFGPDGYLYIATGDSVRDPANAAGQSAQDTNSLLGKILRLDVDRSGENGMEYAIPADNPFVSGGGRPEVFAYGFRNPYRFSFDDGENTRLFVADVGQAQMEEVNLVGAGGNYGWPIREGTSCFNAQNWSQPLASCHSDGLTDPIIAYRHADVLSAVIGGMVYRGQEAPVLQGGYVFGDWGRGQGKLFVAYPPGSSSGAWSMTPLRVELPDGLSSLGQLLGIGRDAFGELYVLVKAPGVGPVNETGQVYKIIQP